jgi:type IV pilus assembly protein PilO
MSDKTPNLWRERLASPLTWHYAAFSVLLLLVIVLAVRFALDWAATSARSTDALAGKQVELRAMDLQTAPLRGLDKRVEETREQIRDFYSKRIPANYSSITSQIGEMEVKSGVRLSRLQYTPGPPGNQLTEISMDSGISGDYSQIMHFVNSLERDKTFFVLRAMSFSSQQGGMVNLRLRLSTWLRAADVPTDTGGAQESVVPQQENTAPKDTSEPSPGKGAE